MSRRRGKSYDVPFDSVPRASRRGPSICAGGSEETFRTLLTCVGLIRLKNARKNILLTQDMIC